jgi:nucleotide-binding universal stress UspA family protein
VNILVGTDFSDVADAALRMAARYARPLHARLHLLHVFSHDEVGVTRLLADAAAGVGDDVPVSIEATAGDPAREILRYADVHAIDLIVVGTHGRTGVSRVLLGSVADRVARHARCPVVVVPATAEREVPERPTYDAAPIRHCLVCAKPDAELICEPCRAHIRGEALEQKQRTERAGRS